jgi:hypothetical protein
VRLTRRRRIMVTKTKDDYMSQKAWYRCECGRLITVPFHVIRSFYNDQRGQKIFNEMKCKSCGLPFGNVGPTPEEVEDYKEREKYRNYSPIEMMAEIMDKLNQRRDK